MQNEQRLQVTVWFTKEEKARVRKAVAWLNGYAPDHIRKALVSSGTRMQDTVTFNSLGKHGIMQLIESCEDMMT